MNEVPEVIPRVEAQWSHQEFVQEVNPEAVMMKITHARRLYRNNESFESYFYPGIDVITTTTVNDNSLNLLPWEQELEIVEQMEPTYHIPTDYSDYTSQPIDTRRENVKKCMEGTIWMDKQLAESNTDTEIVPLLKGTTREEREICYNVFDSIEAETAALYATRYFTAGVGNNIRQLVQDTRTLMEETDTRILVIGLLSPNYVERMPDNVTSVAGQRQWREKIKPRKHDGETMREKYSILRQRVLDGIKHPSSADG